MRIRHGAREGKTRILHIFESNIFFDEIRKNVTEIIEGAYWESYLIERI